MMQCRFSFSYIQFIFCLLFIPVQFLSAAQTSNEVLIQSEIDALGDIYRVVAPNKELAKKAAISFHANLLESDT